jgi:hypothetical protein
MKLLLIDVDKGIIREGQIKKSSGFKMLTVKFISIQLLLPNETV